MNHHNHGSEFYRLIKRTLPQWESDKSRLDRLPEQILNQ
ncbi:MAG: DUF45 domain-containing protein [Xanthomonadales bacterium]|nr:DUF45 domain-containing protein [Xanthomonadales bacterium]